MEESDGGMETAGVVPAAVVVVVVEIEAQEEGVEEKEEEEEDSEEREEQLEDPAVEIDGWTTRRSLRFHLNLR